MGKRGTRRGLDLWSREAGLVGEVGGLTDASFEAAFSARAGSWWLVVVSSGPEVLRFTSWTKAENKRELRSRLSNWAERDGQRLDRNNRRSYVLDPGSVSRIR